MNGNDIFFWLLCVGVVILLSALLRIGFICISKGQAVDHHYWVLAARAYRSQEGLPVRMPGKYILEDDRQAYPFGFGWFLSVFSESFLRSSKSIFLIFLIDFLTMSLVLSSSLLIGMKPVGVLGVLLVYGFAPVIVAYNTQLTSRGLGNLMLVVTLFAQVAAAADTGFLAMAFCLVGVITLAGVFVTHKMTTQFFLFLWPFWPFALASLGDYGALIGLITPFAALALITGITGFRYQALQWRAHWDIVTFWARNWRFLGAHPFRHSPLYGDPECSKPNLFHGKGLTGIFRHAKVLLSYLPLAFLLPITLLFISPPPTFIFVWFFVALMASVLTLFLPFFKCLGGGHLYLFNAVTPAALWWGFALSEDVYSYPVLAIFFLGLGITVLSLVLGAHRRFSRPSFKDEDAFALIDRLSRESFTRVAVFPYTFADQVALETEHAVFWGAHSLGFRTIEPYFPVMRKPVGHSLRSWNVTCAVLDLDFWPEGASVFALETGDANPERYGLFALYKVKP